VWSDVTNLYLWGVDLMDYEQVNDTLQIDFPNFIFDEEERQLYVSEDSQGQYFVAARFVDYLRDCYDKGDVDTYKKGLLFIEKLHLSNSHKTKELATIGYLESFLDWDNRDKLIDDLEPESKKWWPLIRNEA